MRTYSQSHYDQINVRARHIEKVISPNVYAVGTLMQGQYTGMMMPGDRYTYEPVARQFIERLSRRIYGKTSYDRHRKLLPAAVTIEGKRKPTRYHLNFLIQRPEWKDMPEFQFLAIEEWNKLDWTRADFYVGPRTGDCVRYSLKEGPDSLLFITR